MIKHILFSFMIISTAWASHPILENPAQRDLIITRHYEINVAKGKPYFAEIPALMSFWGATNWQVIKSSKFTYTQVPDDVKIASDNLPVPRRFYKLKWDAPKSDKITVEQKMSVQLSYFNNLYTTATLPYSDNVKKRFADSLKADIKQGIDPDIRQLGPICQKISNNSTDAQIVVDQVCDWINENIEFGGSSKRSSNQALAERRGSCTPMARLACAMLRKIGIPSELIDAKFIGGNSDHSYIEVYFPDAGWVFYDLSNWTRGFKSLDCIMTVGLGYNSGDANEMTWTSGYFSSEKNASPFVNRSTEAADRDPSSDDIVSVRCIKSKSPPTVKPRRRPLRELITDLTVPPGPRDYDDNLIGSF